MLKGSLLVLLVLLATVQYLEAVIRPVTNDDIRDAILSVVNMIRSTEDKLERHEYRERALGEQIKKALATMDKRQRLMDPVKGTLHRIDERLATVETILMQKDERERIQAQKTYDTVDQIQQGLPGMLGQIKQEIIQELLRTQGEAHKTAPPDALSKTDLQKVQKDLTDKIDGISKAVKDMEDQVSRLREDNKHHKQIYDNTSDNLEHVKRHLNNSETILEKYENKLAEYNNRIEVSPTSQQPQTDWHTSFLQALEVQKSNVEQILSDVKTVSSKIGSLPNATDLQTANNDTLQAISELKYEVGRQTDKSATILDAKVKELRLDMENKQGELVQSLSDLSEMTESLNGNIAHSYEQLKTEIQALGKVEQVMVQTADSVLDTKRRVEYGVHQILVEIGELIKAHTKEIGSSINDRFDNFELSILDDENGALANLTSKIGEEIDQVWRQIGIMHQQMSASTDTLNKLQNQTDSYVNGSLNTMDNMRGKVGQITSRMSEVDENLNYLLGRLSLVTQEFNQIKTGLGKALDDIKESFVAVQKKIKDAGPGPHQIPDSEVKTADAKSENSVK